MQLTTGYIIELREKINARNGLLRPLFMVPRSRSQMFLTFVSPPKDQDADVAFPNSVYGKNESRCRSQLQCSLYSLAFFRRVVVRFRNSETHTNAPQRHNTLQTMAIEVREGEAAAARQMAQEAAASSRNTAVLCACAHGGKFAA